MHALFFTGEIFGTPSFRGVSVSWLNAPFHKDPRSPSSSDREIITQKNTKSAIVVLCSE